MSSVASMLGSRLVNNAGADVPMTSLNEKVVALYFSASWCGPCRGFTPHLVATYKTLQAAGKPFEVVLIGLDKNQEAFDKYHKEMPWLAVPFEDRARETQLSTKFGVSGIPTLIILDKDGKVITTEGTNEIGKDPEGKSFPWRPKPVSELIGCSFMTKDGIKGSEVIEGKTLALYFSAHWCPPCRAFTPGLIKTYSAIKQRAGGENVEFIFVSSDEDQAGFTAYYQDMPWAAIPFNDSDRRAALAKRLGVKGIPALATVGSDGVIINQIARGIAGLDPKGMEFPWAPKAVVDLSVTGESNGSHLQETHSLVVFMEGADDLEQKEIEEAFLPIAEAEVKARKETGQPTMLFFTAKSVARLPTQVRTICGMESVSEAPQMVIIDVSKREMYVPAEGASTTVTSDSISAFLEAFKQGTLKASKISL